MPPRTTRTPSKTVPLTEAGVSGGETSLPPPGPRASGVRVERNSISGVYAASRWVALLVNGVAGDAVRTDARGRFRLTVPPHWLGGLLDVLDTGSAQSVLDRPVEFRAATRVVWRGWSVSRGRIRGEFELVVGGGDTMHSGGLPLMVEAVGDGAVSGEGVGVGAVGGGGVAMRSFAHAVEDGGLGQSTVAYRFEGMLRSLVANDVSVWVRPILAGLVVEAPLLLTPQTVGFAGHLDARGALNAGGTPDAGGWAVDLDEPARRQEVELRMDGVAFTVVTADALRPDLEGTGLGDGRSGFLVPLPSGLDRRRAITLQAFLAGTGCELAGSPLVIHPPPPVVGYFDGVEGPFASGWAIDMFDPGTPLLLEAVCEGEVIGSGRGDLYRGDVASAGLATPWCGFRFRLERPLSSLFNRDVTIRAAGTGLVLRGSPRRVRQNPNIVRMLTRGEAMTDAVRDRLVRRIGHATQGTPISIVMPVFNTRAEWLMEAINSVLGQWSAHWELIIVDDGSTEQHVREILARAERHDRRIRVMRAAGNMGIARATNFGLRAARGAYVAFMDHDDTIEPDAVYKLAKAAQETGAGLIYSDEALTSEDIGSIIDVRARPVFSHDYYMSHPYFVHIVCVRTSLAQRLGGWDETLAISADVDFVLRATEAVAAEGSVIAHVPSVLYRWRTHEGSAGHARQAEVTAATMGVLRRHLARIGAGAAVSEGTGYNEYRLDWPDDGGEVVIVIPTKNRVDLLRSCIESIERTSGGANYRIVVIDHDSTDRETLAYLRRIGKRHTVMRYSGVFNYALMNNLAVRTHGAGAQHLLFMNNDVEAIGDGWIERLRSLSGRADVGAVGPLLLFGDDRVQHAGVLMAFSGAADHAMKLQAAYSGPGRRNPGYNCALTSVRDYSAVTAACVMMRAEVFRQMGGFDEGFVVGFNDTDLCLRIVDAGFKVLYDGHTVLYHHESATRIESKSVDHPEDDRRLRMRWKRFFVEGDPFYSPLLTTRGIDHMLRQDAGCKGRMGARAVERPVLAGVAPALAGRKRVGRQQKGGGKRGR